MDIANLGIGSAVAGIIAIIVWFLNFNSPERVKQRLRIELAKITLEKSQIESSVPTNETIARLLKIESRIKEINVYLSS